MHDVTGVASEHDYTNLTSEDLDTIMFDSPVDKGGAGGAQLPVAQMVLDAGSILEMGSPSGRHPFLSIHAMSIGAQDLSAAGAASIAAPASPCTAGPAAAYAAASGGSAPACGCVALVPAPPAAWPPAGRLAVVRAR